MVRIRIMVRFRVGFVIGLGLLGVSGVIGFGF
jgi:hypothetical protein